MKKIIFIYFLIAPLFSNESFGQNVGQTEPLTEFSENILSIISRNDSILFLNYTTANKEVINCLKKTSDSVSIQFISYDGKKEKRVFLENLRKLHNEALKIGVNLRDIEYKRLYIQRYNSTYKIRIKFYSNNLSYYISIKELAYCGGHYFICDSIHIHKGDID